MIDKWLKAGVWEEGRSWTPEQGTPQGGVITPVLANIYLHEVLDVWWDRTVLPRLEGRAFLVRFADDFVGVRGSAGRRARAGDTSQTFGQVWGADALGEDPAGRLSPPERFGEGERGPERELRLSGLHPLLSEGERALFDLVSDRFETRNLAKSHSELAETLAVAYQTWSRQVTPIEE